MLLLIVMEECFILFQERKEMKKEEIDISQYEVVLHESKNWLWLGIVFIVTAILCMVGVVAFQEMFFVGIIGFFVFGGSGAGTILCCKNRCLYLSAKELVYQDSIGREKIWFSDEVELLIETTKGADKGAAVGFGVGVIAVIGSATSEVIASIFNKIAGTIESNILCDIL